jgi:MFS family permease
MLTVVTAARFVPMMIFPIIAGVVADRVNRRSLLMTALLSSGVLSLCLALLVATGLIAVWHLIVMGLLGGVVMSFNHPARQTILPNLIKKEHLLNAISLDFISVLAARMVGMALAGYLMVLIGLWPIFVMRALGCIFAVLWLRLARIPPTPVSTKETTAGQSLMEGFHYLRSNPVILGLVVLYLIPWLAGNTISSFLPVFANDILHIGAVGYGYLQASPGLGALTALVGLTFFTYYKSKPRLLVGAGIIMGLGLIGFSASTRPFLSFPFLMIIGAMHTAFSTINTTIIQGLAPDSLRGRIMSWREVAFGLGPTGSIIFGAIAQATGVQISLGILGVVVIIPSLFLIAWLSKFREMGGDE